MAKKSYFGVSGVARNVKSWSFGVSGVARNVKSGYFGVGGIARNFIEAGTPLVDQPIGTIVKLNENGTEQEYIVVNHGVPSSIYDDSCNGIWLLRKNSIEKRAWDADDINNLENSDIQSWLNSTMLEKYDANIKNAIKQVKIPYRKNGGSGGSNQSGANGLTCKVFLLSGYEVGWTSSTSSYFPVDGAKLEYFVSGISASANNKRIAYLNGYANYWWLRSPRTSNTNLVWFVRNDGDYDNAEAYNSYGIRPALIMPFDVLVDQNMKIIVP